MLNKLLLALFVFCSASLTAQDPTPPSGLSDQDLRTWLRSNWFLPWHDELSYDEAREAMYGTIDNEGGNIYCIYTGFFQPAGQVTFPDPINTEHTVPQSWFNSQLPMRSDIHHIFPTHMDANTARGSLPFAEVNDNTVDVWMTGNGGSGLTTSSNTPSADIELYSEVRYNVNFEPREEHKGNTARAIFYFYTMYPSQAGDISEIGNLNQLYDWHVMDPPDDLEIERNEEIQEVQGNYNPYVSMPELLGIAWDFVSGVEDQELNFALYPNPAEDLLSIEIAGQIDRTEVIDMLGNVISIDETGQYKLDLSALNNGVYLIKVQTESGVGVRKFVKKD